MLVISSSSRNAWGCRSMKLIRASFKLDDNGNCKSRFICDEKLYDDDLCAICLGIVVDSLKQHEVSAADAIAVFSSILKNELKYE